MVIYRDLAMKHARVIILLTFTLLLMLSACGGAGGAGDPAGTVEAYMQAKAASDADTIRQLLCSEMESLQEREILTFESVSDVRVEDMACQQVGDSEVVSCSGKIVATYGTEDTEFPLASYRVVQEDGEWKWCGEAAP
jgi:hypothetical protein